jgi:predicted RNase H-like HicB family nuclease
MAAGLTGTEMNYTVLIEKGPASYGAYVPDLPGCVAVAETREEVEYLIKGAIGMHLQGMREDGDPIPEPTITAATVEAA